MDIGIQSTLNILTSCLIYHIYHRFYKAIFCLKYTNVIFITEFSLFIFPILEIHTIGYQLKPDAQQFSDDFIKNSPAVFIGLNQENTK